jgi:large subunit ribosomal protein L21
MYAVIDAGGRQMRVQVGDVIHVDRRPDEPGAAVVFERVLAVGGDETKIGKPLVSGASVRGTVVSHLRDKKIWIHTFKHRKNSSRKQRGHRQDQTAVKIDAIDG